jgi:hypothetical protein
MKMTERIIPNGKCWCGCGANAQIGKFFLSGHDRAAESAVIKVVYGGVIEFLTAHGYGPNGKNPMEELKKYMEKEDKKKK